MNDIVSTGSCTTAFAGSPNLTSVLTFGVAKNLLDLNNITLNIETDGAHGAMFLRLTDGNGNYIEFSMGGDRSGGAGVLAQSLSKTLKEAEYNYTDPTKDFDATDIVSAQITIQTASATVDQSKIYIYYEDYVESDIEFVDGFSTTILEAITDASTTVKTNLRPWNNQTNDWVSECIMIHDGDESYSLYDNAGVEKSKILGEGIWLEYSETINGQIVWNIIHRGIPTTKVPPALGDIKRSLWNDHDETSVCSISMVKGYSDQQVAEVKTLVDDEKKKAVWVPLVGPTKDVVTTAGVNFYYIPEKLTGHNLTRVLFGGKTAGTGAGTQSSLQITRTRSGATVDMLSTEATIDATKLTSDESGTAPVINTANDDVITNDLLLFNLTDECTTPMKGAGVVLEFTKP